MNFFNFDCVFLFLSNGYTVDNNVMWGIVIFGVNITFRLLHVREVHDLSMFRPGLTRSGLSFRHYTVSMNTIYSYEI